MNRITGVIIPILLSLAIVSPATAGDFIPDPASVQREGTAYRYPQAGWIVLHIEGDPYARGVQHGKLMAPEIADYVKAYAMILSPKAPSDGWKLTRRMVDALFMRRFDAELLEEMKGIADGAAAAGAKFDDRPIDLTDIVAINAWPEIDSLDDALRATPNGLEGKEFDQSKSAPARAATKSSRCSAFAATGAATKDGKAMIGHITMFDLYPSNFFNVWIDIKPAKGHRVMLQGAPGSVQSGMDWYQNDAGMVLVETTIGQTKFSPQGMSVGSRSRCAMQYGDTIDAVTQTLSKENNGLYTNEWLLADMKTNEIAMFELGTTTSTMYRSSKNEWFGGTEGFYWGCNNTKSMNVQLETIPSTNDRPADLTFCSTDRDIAWIKLYRQYKGKIDADFGKIAYSKPPLVSRNSCDAKYTTSDLAMQMKANAIFGDPYGQLWEPRPDEREKYPDIKPIVSNPWTILGPGSPAVSEAEQSVAVDLDSKSGAGGSDHDADDDDPSPAWHGTILPAGDGDIWLASAFARFHDYAALSNQLLKAADKDDLSADQRDKLALKLFDFRSMATTFPPQAPRAIVFDPANDEPTLAATGRGVLMLAELRRRMTSEKFDAAMDAFGKQHAGKPTASAAFIEAMQSAAGTDLKDFFHHWLDTPDAMPALKLAAAESTKSGDTFLCSGSITSAGNVQPDSVEVTVETDDGETTASVNFEAGSAKFQIATEKSPTRVIVNKYGLTPIANGYKWSVGAFRRKLDRTIIVYGTRDDAVANQIAAEALQKGIIGQWEHEKLPIKPDTSISEDDLRGHHLVLIGGPSSNELSARFQKALPVKFGPHSFIVRGQTYAHLESGVISAAANPADENFSIVCIAGLSGNAIYRAAVSAAHGGSGPIKILPARTPSQEIVPPAPELVHDFP